MVNYTHDAVVFFPFVFVMQNILQSRVISRTPTGEISSTVAPSCDTSAQAHMQEGELGFAICFGATYTVRKRQRKCSPPLDFLPELPGF